MPTKLFVGNLNNAFSRDELGDLFGQYGKLTEYDLVRNFGFVHFEREEDAIQAMKELNNKVYQGTELHVEMSKCQHKSGKWNPGSSRPQKAYQDRQGYFARERSSRHSPYYPLRDAPRERYLDSRPRYGGSPPPRMSPPYREKMQYPRPKQIRGHSEYREREQPRPKYDNYEGFNRYEGYEGYTSKYSHNQITYEGYEQYPTTYKYSDDNGVAEQ